MDILWSESRRLRRFAPKSHVNSIYSICKVVGCEITATGVNLWTTHPKDFGWRRLAGGTTSPNSQSSSTRCFSCWERRTDTYRRFMWYTTAWCHSAVSSRTPPEVATTQIFSYSFSVWMGMKFAPGGHSTFFAMLNAFVHIVMYL